MAIPILGEIERLINERGSAAILKERLSLAADQYAALERKLAESEIRAKPLEAENQRLELENLKLKEKVRGLEEKLTESQGQRLEEAREKILLILAAHEGISDRQIAQSIGVGEQIAKYHLEELRKSKFVRDSHFMGSDWSGEASRTEWSIAQPGRAYLVTHGLLK